MIIHPTFFKPTWMNVLTCLSSDYSFEYGQTLVSSGIKKKKNKH